MKRSFDKYLQRQLENPTVRDALQAALPGADAATAPPEKGAGFPWYKDLALGVALFFFLILGLGEVIESAIATPLNEHRLWFGLALLGAAGACVLLASSRAVVFGMGLAIVAFRGLVAFVLKPAPLSSIGLGVAISCGAVLYVLTRRMSDEDVPYDPDKSRKVWDFVAVAIGIAVAIVIVRGLRLLMAGYA